jgi:hypothetical protein
VGVGDEFPTEEIRRDENGVVHHHHYYYRRRPFGFLRFILALMLIMLVFRAFHYASWWGWDRMTPPWMPRDSFPFAGTLLLILVVGGILYAMRHHDYGDRP